jgi:GH15 family glucan-1,4-alpha-glucosidase
MVFGVRPPGQVQDGPASTREAAAPAIGDYAIIGGCRSAALISREGSLDWLCLPRFDGPSVFGALLDRGKGGRFSVRPAGRFTVSRRYIGDTNVLETTFRTETGTVRLVDLMPVASENDKRRHLHTDHQILRMVECVDGEAEIEVVCDPRPRYARVIPRLTDCGALGLCYEHASEMLVLRSEIPLALSADSPGAYGREALRRGERRRISLVVAVGEPAIIPPLGSEAEARIDLSIRWWEEWASHCRYEGPARDQVLRSALTLKLLCHAPSGAVIAAPTTSLPEKIGGVRNWDYRYCWLRDASLTLRALFDLGYTTEGESFLSWLLHATRLTWPELQVLYDVYGETRLPERELDHLEGYAGSRPVRVGNDAAYQFQLDVYGEVVEAVFQYVLRGGRLDRSASRMLAGLGKTVCRRWREPDEGIWEIRAGRRHHTYSKAMCWVTLDRLIRLHERRHVKIPVREFSVERDAIRREIETRG